MIRAARFLGVPPWELLDRPANWLTWASMAENAIIGAQNVTVKRANPSG